MRYPKEHKEQARQKLLAASGGHAKQHGFAASGVDALAAAAGVTAGSLYKHFDSKDALFIELVRAELDRTSALFAHLRPGDGDALRQVSAAYLSLQHVRAPEAGCVLPTLTAEVARAPLAVRETFEQGLQDQHARLSELMGSSDAAWALIAQNVGAVMLARAMAHESTQRQVLGAVRRAGDALIGPAAPTPDLP